MKLVAFVICSGVGYLLGHYLPEPWATYAAILISYHLYLAWLVISAEHEAGFSLPVMPTVLTHLACLVVLVGLAIGRRYVPFLGLVRIFVPALAPFEANWLFNAGRFRSPPTEDSISDVAVGSAETASSSSTSGTSASPIVTQVAAPVAAPVVEEYTAEDDAEWRRYLATPHREFRKKGISIGDELKLWMAARAQAKVLRAQNQRPDSDVGDAG